MPAGEPPSDTSRRRGPLLGRLIGAGARTGLRGAQRVAESTGLDQAAEDAVADAVVRALESPAAERAIAQALESPAVERSLVRTIDSEMVDRVWERLLDSDEIQKTIERVAQAPEIRSAIASQGFGLIDDIGAQVSRAARRLDSTVERIARRIFRRPQRTGEPQQAGFVSRAIALALDAAVVNLSFLALSAGVALVARFVFDDQSADGPALVVGTAAWLAAASVYLVTFWSLSGETPGMRFLDLRLRGPDGPRIGLRRAIRRLIGAALAVLPFGLGLVPILFSERRRGFQDRFADTEVRYLPPSREAPWSRGND